jgi:hypothetical protein
MKKSLDFNAASDPFALTGDEKGSPLGKYLSM